MMTVATKLDNRLVRALHEGAEALPGDLAELRSYLRLIEALLTEKAAELEPSWQQACAAAAEITTLQTLEITVDATATCNGAYFAISSPGFRSNTSEISMSKLNKPIARLSQSSSSISGSCWAASPSFTRPPSHLWSGAPTV